MNSSCITFLYSVYRSIYSATETENYRFQQKGSKIFAGRHCSYGSPTCWNSSVSFLEVTTKCMHIEKRIVGSDKSVVWSAIFTAVTMLPALFY